MKKLIITTIGLLVLFSNLPVRSVSNTGNNSVKIKIAWTYKDFPKNVKMEIYEPSPNRTIRLWDTTSEKDPNNIPISSIIKNSTLQMIPGGLKRFILVLKNKTSKPIYFFASPHHIDPPEHSLGFKFKCLCIDHTFEVKPGETWYRVVQLKLSSNFVGKSINITHTLVTVSDEVMEKFKLFNE
ncbi:MAG: hypothetical protein OEV44_09070 [Spirochaetota bacterium]|nr:hypothetical protein [Spirochaetota bacterium]